MWIHEHQHWTDFTWNSELIASRLAEWRDIQNLKERAIFIQNPGQGRSTSYRLIDKVKLL